MIRRLITADSAYADLLRRPAKRVKNVQSTEVILGIQDMKRIAMEWEHETGHKCEGLAAPQIGWNARVIIIRKSDEKVPKKPNADHFHFESDAAYHRALKHYNDFMHNRMSTFDPWHVLINPQFLHKDGEQESIEACLSLPGSAYKVRRSETVYFKFRKPDNHMSQVMVVKGKDAAALEHEYDHLTGTLLTDIAIEAYLGKGQSHPL